MKKIKAFIALDSDSINKNVRAIQKLSPYVYGFKVGYRAFYQKGSEKLIQLIKKNNSKLFLDLKLHDIPNTVATGIDSLKNIKPDYLTVHISGGGEMMKTALKSIVKNKLKTKILGVTLLTSLDSKDSKQIYNETNTSKLVKKFAALALKSKLKGIICSGLDLENLKGIKGLMKITPGVKLFSRDDDQKRVAYVHDAISNGASYVVIGRELINATDPQKLLKKYYEKYPNKSLWTN